MEVEDAVNSEPPFREGEPPSPPGPEVATAQAAVWKASEVVGVSEISQEIIEDTDLGNGMLPSGGRAEPSVEGEAGDWAGEGSSMKDDSKKDSGIRSNEEGIAADEKAEGKKAEKGVHVLDGNEVIQRSYSVERFGQILLLSQWSLKHRIEVCQVLQNSSNWWIMTPLSRHAYAKQSLALINKELKDIGEESSKIPSYESFIRHYEVEDYHKGLQAMVEELVYQDWKQLTGYLEAELERVRREDKSKEWYTTSFKNEGSFQPEDIYLAVEKGQVEDVEKMMVEMGGREDWALYIVPQEYQGATPWHWAALHLKDFPHYIRLFLKSDGDGYLLRDYRYMENIDIFKACDNFNFTILHMVIFASSWIPFYPERSHDRDETAIHNCLHLLEEMIFPHGKKQTWPASDFLIFKLCSYYERSSPCYGIKDQFTKGGFLHLAIAIGHPYVISMLITKMSDWHDLSRRVIYERDFGHDVFNWRTKCGDSILHLGTWYMDPNFEDYCTRKRVMVTLLQNLHHYPRLLNSRNKAGQTPLHIAVFQRSKDCVNALLKCLYLKVDVQNNNGLTPLDMAKKLDVENLDSQKKREAIKKLGRKSVIDEEFGFSTYKYNDVIIPSNYDKVADLIQGFNPKLSQWKVVQSSQWNLRHRILALQMLSENPSTLGNMRGPYVQQCLKLVSPSLSKDTHNFERIAKHLRQLHPESPSIMKRIPSHHGIYILRKIFCAIEEDDGDEFRHLMMKIRELWGQGLEEYKGATPLHWATLYGRRDMISFMKKEMENFDKGTEETWHIKVHDEFGFTPLHLVAFSSPLRLGYTKDNKDEIGRDAEKTVESIDELYEMGVPDTAVSTSQSEFLVWNSGPNGAIYLDDHLSNSNLHPMFLGVHFSHPRIVQKLLERTNDQNFAKNILSAGDSILHCARAWERLINHCSEDERRKLETILFMHLENQPKAVNSRNLNRETPLHIAVRTKSLKWVGVLLQSEHVKFTLRDRDIRTPGDLAAKMLKDPNEEAKDEIQNIIDLIDSFDPESVPRREKEQKQKAREEKKDREKKEEDKEKEEEANRRRIEALQRDRQVYVDAANAILVGGALVASASFGAWLQPPLGFHPYYSPEFLDTTAPPSVGPVYESFVAIQQYWILHLFWVFNSLSFFFSLATVMAGADAALPQPGFGSGTESDVIAALKSVKRAVKVAAWLLILAIIFVICTFATLGFTVLPPITKYRINLIVTLGIGGLVCIWFLIRLVMKLVSEEKGFLIRLVMKLVSEEKGSDLKEKGPTPNETPAPTSLQEQIPKETPAPTSLQEQIPKGTPAPTSVQEQIPKETPAPTSLQEQISSADESWSSEQEQISSPDEPCPSEQEQISSPGRLSRNIRRQRSA